MSRMKNIPAAAAMVAITSLLGTSALAAQGDWLVRVGASVVDPKSDNLTLAPTTKLQVEDDTRPTFDVTYMFRDKWGVELLASTPWTHDLTLKTAAGNVALGEVQHLPPTLSVQYHFNPAGRIRPYVGLGINYTLLFKEEPATLSVDNSFGPAAQLGVDVGINDRWFVNLSARYIDIDADARLGGADIGTVEVDPFVYGIHVGFKLGGGQ
jgi:outer membrane protein